jgi:hypothetical protein
MSRGYAHFLFCRIGFSVSQVFQQRPVKQRYILGNDCQCSLQAAQGNPRYILAAYADRSALRLVEMLKQRQYGGFPSPRRTDHPDPFPCPDSQAEPVKDGAASWIGKRHFVELDTRVQRLQRDGVGRLRQAAGCEYGAHRFGEARDVLRHVYQRNGQVARTVQDGKSKRADQHDVTRRRPFVTPEPEDPAEQARGKHGRHDGMREP